MALVIFMVDPLWRYVVCSTMDLQSEGGVISSLGVNLRGLPTLLGHDVHVDDVAGNREGEVACHDEHEDSPVGGFSPEEWVPETVIDAAVEG